MKYKFKLIFIELDYLLKISTLLSEKKIEKKELAKKLNYTPQTLSNYFTGKTKLEVDTLIKIASALEVPVSALFEEKPFINTDIIKLQKENEELRKWLNDKELIIELLKKEK